MKKRNLWIVALTVLLVAAWSNVYGATYDLTWLATEHRAKDARFDDLDFLEYFKMLALCNVDTTELVTFTGYGDPIGTVDMDRYPDWDGPIYKQHGKTFDDTSGGTPFANWENKSFRFETNGPSYAYRNTTDI